MPYQSSVIVPEKGVRPGKNGTGADIGAARFVALVAAGNEDPAAIRLPVSGGVKVYGCTMNAIKDGQIGDIQCEGRTRVVAGSGGLAVGSEVSATTAGAGIVATVGHVVIGVCVKAAASGEIAEVELATAAGNGRIVPA